jgi:riboflavin-specific deaminase-like protein
MINTNNIADLFNFIQNHEKNNSLIIKITKNKIKIVKNKKNADLIINNKYITVNKNIDLILRQCCEIIIPLVLKNNCNFIGQIGQSLDGKIALNNGNSHYINEKESITYLHCLRSISDGVLVGVNTIIKDDPFLTTRKIKGLNPIRLIIDPSLKLTKKYNIFKDNNKNIILTYSSKEKKLSNSTIIKFPKKNFTLSVYKYLRKTSLKTILIEGGPTTLSHFIEHKFLNYMQFIISPTVIGSGIDSMKLKPISNLKNAIRTKNTINRLGKEIIVTLDFNS